jgi:uncharacterized membrane protein YphA (DoxX/SURF4 family)
MPPAAPRSLPRILLILGRIALGAIFIYAAWTKLHPPVAISLSLFALQVDSYRMLPPWAVNTVAHTLPFLELALGALLVIGWPLRIVSSVTSLLLLAFFGTMVRSYALGLEINCGCFGPNEKLGAGTLLRDGALLALALAVTIGAFWKARAGARIQSAGLKAATSQPQS